MHTPTLFSLPWQISTKLASVVEQSVFFCKFEFSQLLSLSLISMFCLQIAFDVTDNALCGVTMTRCCCSKPLARQKI